MVDPSHTGINGPATSAFIERRTTVIGPADPRRFARAVLQFQNRNVRTAVTLGAVVICLAATAATGAWMGASGLALGLAVVSVALVRARGRLASTLTARGFAPGTQIAADFFTDSWTILTPNGSSRHFYADVDRARLIDGVVLVRIRSARVIVIMPVELVAAGAASALGLAPLSAPATASPNLPGAPVE
jgi:hypothetical protein